MFSKKFYKEKMSFAREVVAQAWCKRKTKRIVFDPILADEFAKILIHVMYEPHLGCATTGELLAEIKARIQVDGKLDYRTITGEEKCYLKRL